MIASTKQQLCNELLPAYQSWKRAVEQAEEVKNEKLAAGAEADFEELKSRWKGTKEEINKAREEYEKAAYEKVEYMEYDKKKSIVRKDAVLLANIEEKEKLSIIWHSKNERVDDINFDGQDLSSVKNLYFPDSIRRLNLNNTTLPSKLTVPDYVEDLHLSSTDLPDNLTIPDGLITLSLDGATSLENLTFIPNSVRALGLERTVLPDNLTIPDNVEYLNLQQATLSENLTIPDSVRQLFLTDAIVRDTSGNEYPIGEHQGFRQKLKELKQSNPNVRILGVGF